MKVFFTSPTKQDQKELEDAGLKASLLDDRVKNCCGGWRFPCWDSFHGTKKTMTGWERIIFGKMCRCSFQNSQTAGLFACLRTIFTMTRPEIQIKLSLLVL